MTEKKIELDDLEALLMGDSAPKTTAAPPLQIVAPPLQTTAPSPSTLAPTKATSLSFQMPTPNLATKQIVPNTAQVLGKMAPMQSPAKATTTTLVNSKSMIL
jgi:hypothetical protein